MRRRLNRPTQKMINQLRVGIKGLPSFLKGLIQFAALKQKSRSLKKKNWKSYIIGKGFDKLPGIVQSAPIILQLEVIPSG